MMARHHSKFFRSKFLRRQVRENTASGQKDQAIVPYSGNLAVVSPKPTSGIDKKVFHLHNCTLQAKTKHETMLRDSFFLEKGH
jgi:hypothetical protein